MARKPNYSFERQERERAEAKKAEAKAAAKSSGGFTGFVVRFGEAIGMFINTLLASGRQSLKLVMNTIIPFMAYVSLLIGIVTFTGVSEWIANGVRPLAENPLGLILLANLWTVIDTAPALAGFFDSGAS